MADISWKLYRNSIESWDAMLLDCERATKSIDCEQFIFAADEIGVKFIELFIRKAKEGVKVRLLCDAVGSYPFMISSVPSELGSVGIDVRFFNPISPRRIYNFTSNFFRSHIKILVVDGEIAHTGGVNIRSDMKDWRDTNIRCEGELVAEIQSTFLRTWEIAGAKRFLPFHKSSIYVKHFAVRVNAPHFRQRFMYHELLEVIRNAKKYVYLTTPYFIPDLRFFRVIRLAAKRGVDVRILLPRVSDHLLGDIAAQSHFSLMLKAKVRIFRYKGAMLHAKTAVIDNSWASVGSLNLDNLSFLFNYEANIVSDDQEFASTMYDHFLKDLDSAEEIKKDTWYKRGFLKKTLEGLTWPIHKFL